MGHPIKCSFNSFLPFTPHKKFYHSLLKFPLSSLWSTSSLHTKVQFIFLLHPSFPCSCLHNLLWHDNHFDGLPTDLNPYHNKVPPSPVGSRGKLWMSMYNVLYLRASTYELDAYKDRGTPQPMKHMRAIHKKYCELIDRHMGKSTNNGTTKSPKVPEHKAYSSEEDAKTFEGWLKNLLRWYRINRYCGMEHDKDHISCMALFLQGDVLCWYDDNVDAINHWKDIWSFKTIVMGLYDQFIHNVVLTEASEKFGKAQYIEGEGVMAFYYRPSTKRNLWLPPK